MSTARDTLPEPLSGLREPAVVELPPGRPWLALSELNRLIRQQGQARPLARAWLLDQLVHAIPLPIEEEKALMAAFLERRGITDDDQVPGWLQERGLVFDDLRMLATQKQRLQRLVRSRWSGEVEVRFLQRKPELDQVVYSLLRVESEDLAAELHHQIAEGEADFADLAPLHSSGPERHCRGQIGPLPLATGHPSLVSRLRRGRPGQLFDPFEAGDSWVVLRLEQFLPAELNAPTRERMMSELFEEWLEQRVRLLLEGQPLPPLDAMLALLQEDATP
ncbi:peptidylprolyl isomerase [Cyanobium gracile]|uniref:peptidylprolyl isomerase n=1 Tax=Cyanobium gracile (strain ATCC 27147 / PCC 6307) TaxID=292564 RepID=K9P6Y7_CYAGP|nr:peptidylprolyl isomerase [Cyanobium gracile]AFY28319.1 parvulin-like peptidyl-prolyl isomerase [Cyanobium gracile PCC 6307]